MFGRAPRLILGREYHLEERAVSVDEAVLSLRDLSSHVLLAARGDDGTAISRVLIEQVLLQDVPCVIFDSSGSLLDDEASLNPEFSQRVSVRRQRLGLDEAAGVFAAYVAPPDSSISWQRQGDLLREHIARLCSILLARLGRSSDPVHSREHVLLAAIFESTWRAGQRISSADLVQMINHPPLNRIGEFDMDVYLPVEERAALALAFSELAAGPAFDANAQWAIDAASLLQPDRSGGGMNPAGRTRATVFDLSNLDDRDRRFFAATVMAQLLLWMRLKSGVPHLRCVVYFGDADAFDPEPLRALLRHGRAAGFGIIMHTQHVENIDPDLPTRLGVAVLGAGVSPSAASVLGNCPAVDQEVLEERVPGLEAGSFVLCIAGGRDRPQPPLPVVFRLVDAYE